MIINVVCNYNIVARYWHLNNGNDPSHHHHQVGRLPVVSNTASNNTEGGITKHSQGGNLKQSCCQQRLFFTVELDLFDSTEADEDGEQGEEHDAGVTDVSEEDSQLRHVELSVVNQDKEEDQANQSGDQNQQAKEKTLKRERS